ncbi:Sugar phosphate isomerase/epimerase [Anaerovirgula multivorans]|uniref:Sugar phosphate isomerase/epimerase n=1 Tax=Anaerovirgula multivorans TaxID=312168 RepID=A0A239CBW8_9FIRM|nr:sugar phosphate isomerase/epimerase family protein [Anaerovirgula multivorans]SNS17158.1 Sugar phosphate isomerase/epimerase [Anaerovirgula multivorans]
MKVGTGIYLEKFSKNPNFYRNEYQCLEIQDFVMPDNLGKNRHALVNKYNTMLKNYKGILSVHGPYIDLHPTSFDPLIRDVCMQRYRQVLSVAKNLNAKYVILHSDYEPIKEYNGYEDYLLQQNIIFWEEFIKEFETLKITAVIENIHNKDGSLIKNIIDAVNSPYLGACLDTGHAYALGKSDITTWVEYYGQRLRYIHLHDNHGAQDQHLPLGEGSIDFKNFFRKLREIRYDSLLICEIFGEINIQRQNLKQLEHFMCNR